jgi:hypothetical protein
MATLEGEATKRVRLAASSLGMKLMRNNSGAVTTDDGRFFRFGLGNESPKLNAEMKFGDLIGCTKVLITPNMVGKEVAVFTMFEVKQEGTLTKVLKRATSNEKSREAGQYRAINFIRDQGGIAWFAGNEGDVNAVYNLFLQGLEK